MFLKPSQTLSVVIAFLVFLTLTVFAAGWYSPQSAKWLVIALLSGICWMNLAWAAARGSLRFDSIDAIAFVLFCWVAVSISWSADPLSGKDTTFHWAMLLGVFYALRRRMFPLQTAAISVAIAAGTAVIIAIASLRSGSSGGYFNQNYVCETLLTAMPFTLPLAAALAATRWRWIPLALAIGVAAFLLLLNGSKIKFAVWSVLIIMLLAAVLAKRSWRQAAVAVTAFLSVVTLGVLLGWENISIGDYHGFRTSLLPRAELTIDSFLVWLTRPILGVGAGGFNAVLPYYKDAHAPYLNISKDTAFGHGLHEAPEAAHDDILQFLANFGLVGILLVGIGIYLAWPLITEWRRSPERTTGLLVVLTTLISALIEFPLQLAATLLLFVIGLAWLLPALRQAEDARAWERSMGFRLAIGGMAVIAMTLNTWGSWSYFHAHEAFAKAISAGHVGRQQRLVYNTKAIELYPYEAIFRRQYLITLMDWDFASDARVLPPQDYDRIFEVANTAGPETGTLFLRLFYLISSGRFRERGDEFQRWRNLLLSQSSRVPEVWITEAMLAIEENDRRGAENALKRYAILTKGVTPDSEVGIITELRSELVKRFQVEQH